MSGAGIVNARDLADALDMFWNASLEETHRYPDETANAVMAGMVHGFAAVAAELRSQADAPPPAVTPDMMREAFAHCPHTLVASQARNTWFAEFLNAAIADPNRQCQCCGVTLDGQLPFDDSWSKMPDVAEGETWRHHNGNEYTVKYITNLAVQRAGHPPDVVYEGANGNVWSRPLADWHRSFTFVRRPDNG